MRDRIKGEIPSVKKNVKATIEDGMISVTLQMGLVAPDDGSDDLFAHFPAVKMCGSVANRARLMLEVTVAAISVASSLQTRALTWSQLSR